MWFDGSRIPEANTEMKSSSSPSDNAKWYALVGGLAAVLILLAALQYDSSRKISRATTEQMLTNLAGSLANMRQGLEAELAPLCRELGQDDAAVSNDSLPNFAVNFARRVEHWRRSAPHPGLVSTVYIWQQSKGSSSNLLQLQSQQNEFEPAEWPSNFSELRQRLQQMAATMEGSEAFLVDHGAAHDSEAKVDHEIHRLASRVGAPILQSSGIASEGWMIDDNIPVLVHPVFESDGGSRPTEKRRARVTWVFVVLNLTMLRGHIFPELVRRYLGSNDELPYEVAVVNEIGGRRDVIYSSDPTFGRIDTVPDAALNFFGPPVPVVGWGRRAIGIPAPAGSLAQPLKGRRVTSAGSPTLQNEAGPFRIEPIHYSEDDYDWEIIAQHRKGSVEAAVATLFHRNVALNFSVLLLLAATVGVIVDVSNRARRLGQLQMDFVASVSHELRTPLTAIVSAAQNIADGVVLDKKNVARYGSAIVDQAQQLTELIEQILLFSATEKNLHRYHLQRTDVSELIATSLANTSTLIQSAGVTVEQRIDPDLPPVMVDFKAFSQCLQNLITNAVKYGGEKPWIGIRASVEAVAGTAGTKAGAKEVQIAITDRGIGIAKEDLKRVFEPFYRSPVATAAQIHGSGLGLPLAKTITEAMGGRLTVESVQDEGSTFTVHLPTGNQATGD